MEIKRKRYKLMIKKVLIFLTKHKVVRNVISNCFKYIPILRKYRRRIPLPNYLESFLLVSDKKVRFTCPSRCNFSKQIYWDKGKIDPIEDRMALEVFLQISAFCSRAYDIGCNTCQFAVSACAINEKLQTFAFEILPEARSIAIRNACANKISAEKLVIENIGLAETDGNISVPIDTYSPSLMSAYGLDSTISEGNKSNKAEIRITTLDRYIEEKFVEDFNGSCLIKLDVEGFESNVLEGEQNNSATNPFIICEIINKSKTERIQNLEKHNTHYLITNRGLVQSKNIYCNIKFRDWLFVPKENEKNKNIINEIIRSGRGAKGDINIRFKYLNY